MSNIYSDYIKSLYDIPILTREEENELHAKIKQGDMLARDKLITHNLKLVVSEVRKTTSWRTEEMPHDDLIQLGNEALLEAVDRWEPRPSARFATFARRFIARAVRRGCEKYAKLIRLPVNIEEQIRKVKYTERKLSQELGREAKPREVAERLGKTELELAKLQQYFIIEPCSLDVFNNDKLNDEGNDE